MESTEPTTAVATETVATGTETNTAGTKPKIKRPRKPIDVKSWAELVQIAKDTAGDIERFIETSREMGATDPNADDASTAEPSFAREEMTRSAIQRKLDGISESLNAATIQLAETSKSLDKINEKRAKALARDQKMAEKEAKIRERREKALAKAGLKIKDKPEPETVG